MAVLRLWGGVQTQWRHGFAGPTGLDYAGVRASPAWHAAPLRRRERLFAELVVMERAALVEWGRMARERHAAGRG